MTEETAEPVKKRRGWPPGKKRGPRKPPVEVHQIESAPQAIEAPIHVRIKLKNYAEEVEFGCARRTFENGFHVFFYPSRRDPYRETRREFSVGEIIEIEITEARPVYQSVPAPVQISPTLIPREPEPARRPVIHSARKSAIATIQALETSVGPVKMDEMPSFTFGGSDG